MHLAVSMNICIRAHKPHKDISGKSRDHHERTRGTGTGIAIPSGITTSFSFMHVLHLKSAIGSAGFMTPPVTEARCFHMQSLSPSHMEQRVVCPLMASMYSSIYCTRRLSVLRALLGAPCMLGRGSQQSLHTHQTYTRHA